MILIVGSALFIQSVVQKKDSSITVSKFNLGELTKQTNIDTCNIVDESDEYFNCELLVAFNPSTTFQGNQELTTIFIKDLLQNYGINEQDIINIYVNENTGKFNALIRTPHEQELLTGRSLQDIYRKYILLFKRVEVPEISAH
jgi:hypothetical protein